MDLETWCSACPADTFSDHYEYLEEKRDASTCTQCNDGVVFQHLQSPAQSSGPTDCVCMNGYTTNFTASDASGRPVCQACALGTFKNESNTRTDACVACPAHSGTDATATINETSCRCNAGYTGPNGAACTACPVGTFKNASGSGECEACPAGKYAPLTHTPGQTSEGAGCRACPAGTYLETPREVGKTSCTLCAAGTYSDQMGAADPTTCRDCPGNSTSGQGTDQREHCSCNAGYHHNVSWPERARLTDDEYCAPCSPGFYNIETNRTECTPCPAGQASPHLIATDHATCTTCTVGKYAESWEDECQSCCAHETTSGNASTSHSACVCEAGYELLGDSSASGVCTACEPGFYKPQRGDDANCTACPAYASTDAEAQTELSACRCNAGYVGENGGTCTACAQGTYAAQAGLQDCSDCPANTTTTGAATAVDEDDACFCEMAFGYTDASPDACVACPEGTKQPEIANAFCTSCPDGASNTEDVSVCKCRVGVQWHVGRCRVHGVCRGHLQGGHGHRGVHSVPVQCDDPGCSERHCHGVRVRRRVHRGAGRVRPVRAQHLQAEHWGAKLHRMPRQQCNGGHRAEHSRCVRV